MKTLFQSPTDPGFVQDPYPFYETARAHGPMVHWNDYAMPAALSHATVSMILKDRRFGREVPPELAAAIPGHLKPFYAVEAHSMLELEPPRHTRLRSLVLRAFTSQLLPIYMLMSAHRSDWTRAPLTSTHMILFHSLTPGAVRYFRTFLDAD